MQTKGAINIRQISRSFVRRKVYHYSGSSTSSLPTSGSLSAVLSTFDLINLGVGSILGAGMYVVLGEVVFSTTGPSACLSFLIAAFASLLAGLCYAEFGSRVPHTSGSAYAYSYYTVGEFFAFVIGWNLVMEYIIGAAADARALSGAIDHLTNNTIKLWTKENLGLVPYLNSDYDLLGCLLTLVVTILLAVGVKESARFSAVFNLMNILVAIFIVIIGSMKADPSYWSESFAPEGGPGILAGAATCFYAFVGFDIIATTGEEAKSPSRSIPIAISVTLVLCLVIYLSMSIVLSMLAGYSDPRLNMGSAIVSAVDLHVTQSWPRWVISFGALCGLSSSLVGSQFPLPRIVYAMAKDGLLFNFLTNIHHRTETPLIATLTSGLLTCIFTLVFDLSSLVEMMSSGTLLAYSLVCTSVLILRFNLSSVNSELRTARIKMQTPKENKNQSNKLRKDLLDKHLSEPLIRSTSYVVDRSSSTSSINHGNKKVNTLTTLFWIFSFVLGGLFRYYENIDSHYTSVYIAICSVLTISMIAMGLIINYQPRDNETIETLYFYVPLVPTLPLIAIFFHICLLLQLSPKTWARFTVWNLSGVFIYLFYGLKNASKKFEAIETEVTLNEDDEVITDLDFDKD